MSPEKIDELEKTYQAYETSEKLIKSYQSDLDKIAYTPEVKNTIERKLMFEKNRLAIYEASIDILLMRDSRYDGEDFYSISLSKSPICIILKPGSESEKILGRSVLVKPIFTTDDLAALEKGITIPITAYKVKFEVVERALNISINVSDIIKII